MKRHSSSGDRDRCEGKRAGQEQKKVPVIDTHFAFTVGNQTGLSRAVLLVETQGLKAPT
jgi:hypothetical protein